MKYNYYKVVYTILFATFTSMMWGQTNLVHSKNTFKDVVWSAENVSYDGSKSTVVVKSPKYAGLSHLYGNLNNINRNISVGDFKVKYEYLVTQADKKSNHGMLYRTYNQTTGEHFTLSYLINQNGELLFYAQKDNKRKPLIPLKEHEKLVVQSFKKGNEKNQIVIERKNRNWLLIINSDTIKNVIEPIYTNTSGSYKSEKRAPLLKFDSNVLIYSGKQTISFDNCYQAFYAINEEFEKDKKSLEEMAGVYLFKPKCKEGSSTYIFNVEVKYQNDGFEHMVHLSGVSNKPQLLYLKKHTVSGVWYCDLNDSDALIVNGETYPIKKLYFYTSSPRITFEIHKSEIKNNAMYSIHCDYIGDKIKK